MLEGHAIEVFHGDEGLAVLFADVVDGADVGVIQSGCGLGFALKTGENLRIAGNFGGKEFERDKTMQASVFGFIDNAHTSTAETFDDAVVRKRLADERVGAGHVRDIIFWASGQVNESKFKNANKKLAGAW